MQNTTIAAIATAPGAGGIAVVRLSGPESYAVAARVFHPANPNKNVEEAKGYTALFGSFVEGDDAFDEGVALFFREPHSYTGEDVVELSCHGGSAVARRLVEACIAAGAAPAAPGEYTRRAFLNGKMSLTQAEAVMDMISADGKQGAALANASLSGALAKKIGAEKEALTGLQAHLAAWVDFPEEDVPELDDAHLHTVLGQVQQELDGLIKNYDAGAVLREGVDCAIVGRPNAGKSTLLNLLAGFDRAIVTPVAGTTRDVVEQAVQLGDIRLNLFDTAGLRQTDDAIEAEGIRRSWKKLDEAGLILAVFDGSEPLTREDLALAQRCAGRPAIALVNKEDKPTRFDAEIIAGGIAKPEDVAPFAGKIRTEAQRLLALIEDIIHLSRLDEGGETVAFEPVELSALCDTVRDRLQSKAAGKGIALRIEGEPAAVSGQRRTLEQMIFNLTDNAINYNKPQGSVTLTTGTENGRPFVQVADTGIGIAPADQQRVFERFYRVDKSHSKMTGGTGLGLSIVKHGAALHHAEVELKSALGEGTCITLRFPKE